MIVDASIVIDAVVDQGAQGAAARHALAQHPASEPLAAPGHLAFEVMSALGAVANRPGSELTAEQIEQALLDAESLEIVIEPIPWADVHRAWTLSRASLRYADAIYVAAAERRHMALLTSNARIGRSRAPIRCQVVTVGQTAAP